MTGKLIGKTPVTYHKNMVIRGVAKQLVKRSIQNHSYPYIGPSGIRNLVHQQLILAGKLVNKSEVNKAIPNKWFEKWFENTLF